jgi:Flp pilus assembly protein TadB
MNPTIILIVGLVAIAAGALAYAFLFPQIEDEKRTTNRFKRVQAAETDLVKVKAAKDRVQELSRRRKSMQDSLKDLENAAKSVAIGPSKGALNRQASAPKLHVFIYLALAVRY